MVYPLVSSQIESRTERIRVLLAVDSAHYAQMISRCVADSAPELEVVFFTDGEGRALDSSDTVDLLTTIADSEPHVMVHATTELEPNTDLYGWIFVQFPFLPIVHVNVDGRIRRIRHLISIDEFSGQVRNSSEQDDIGRLVEAIRHCTQMEEEVVSNAVGQSAPEEVLLSESLTQFPSH
jgi:hypothetical protein